MPLATYVFRLMQYAPTHRRSKRKSKDMAHSTLRRPSRKRVEMPVLSGPRPSTVHAILSYSKALRVLKVPPIGQVEVVLN